MRHSRASSSGTAIASSLAGWTRNHANPEHSHEFDARAMVLAGEITITRGDEATTFRPGDSCTVPAGTPHAELAGPQGVAYVFGYRTPG